MNSRCSSVLLRYFVQSAPGQAWHVKLLSQIMLSLLQTDAPLKYGEN